MKKYLIIALVALLASMMLIPMAGRYGYFKSSNKYPVDPGLEKMTSDGAGLKVEIPLSDREVKARNLINELNVPIVFWGKVVDENGKVLSNVRIKYVVRRMAYSEKAQAAVEETHEGAVAADEVGRFTIENENGTTLIFEGFDKPGYIAKLNQKRIFDYSLSPEVHIPNKLTPSVFVLKLEKLNEDIKSYRQQIQLAWDGKEVRIPLTEVGSGDLVVVASRSSTEGHFDWKMTLSVADGNVKEAGKGEALLAPEDGYLPTWTVAYGAESKPWRSGLDTDVFYKREGHYGRINLRIEADSSPEEVSLQLETFLNSSGGRSTERTP